MRISDWSSDVCSSDLDRLADGLAVGDLRLADIGLDVELAPHAVDEDVQVQLTHAGDDGLAGLFVGMHAERRVLLCQTPQGHAHFFLVGLGLRLNRHRDDGLRKHHALRSEEHTSELQSLMLNSYAVFCLTKK